MSDSPDELIGRIQTLLAKHMAEIRLAVTAARTLDRLSVKGPPGSDNLGWLSPSRLNREEWDEAWRTLRSALGLEEAP